MSILSSNEKEVVPEIRRVTATHLMIGKHTASIYAWFKSPLIARDVVKAVNEHKEMQSQIKQLTKERNDYKSVLVQIKSKGTAQSASIIDGVLCRHSEFNRLLNDKEGK